MKHVKNPADIGATDLGTLMNQQAEQVTQPARPEPRSEVYVHVLEVTFHGENGWTSVHRTREGAVARLEAKVDEFDARAAYEAAEGVVTDHSIAAGEEGDPVVYGITRLPVEE